MTHWRPSMAEAVRHDAVTEVREIEPERVVLTLTCAEAEVLRDVLGGITGGGPGRDATSAIFHALKRSGFHRVPHSKYIFVGRFESAPVSRFVDTLDSDWD